MVAEIKKPEIGRLVYEENSLINLHADDAVEVDVEDDRLIIVRKMESLKDNLLLGIQASQEENLEFSESFDELESETW